MLYNLVSRCFSLFDMKKYLFCRVLPHINSQKLRGNGIGIPFLTPRTHQNNEKLKLSSTNKTHVYSLLVTIDVLRLYVVTEKSKFLCTTFRILIHSDPKILQISFLKPFSVKACNKLQKVSASRFTETSFDSKKHLYRGISISLYSHFSYLT